MTPDEFLEALAAAGYELTEQQIQQFERYFEMLIDWNLRVNLTAITEKSAVYAKHFYDSLAPVFTDLVTDKSLKLLDIGAGAGFPSLPMKILCPQLKITIIDSLQKRINFLSELTASLNLTDVSLLHGRAEDFGKSPDYRGQFDFVTARAVARLNVLSELTIPFLKKSGQLIAFKASQFDSELAEAERAIRALGGKYEKALDYSLPDDSERHLAIITKVNETAAKYPRKAGTPNKNPL